MTVEAAVPKTIFPTIAGTGPYAIGWPYGGTDVIVTVVDDGVRTVLAGADFSLSPASSDTSGSVFISPAAAALYAGAQLIAERSTPEEQGWTGVYPGEKGIEAQLDRTTRRIQEISRNQQGTLRIDGTTEPGSVATDRLLLWDGTKIVPGPTAAEIPAAEGYAEEARAWAIEAEDIEVETGLFSAFHWAQKAADSAAAAAVFDPILYARKDQNLNDLLSKPTARTNLGLGNGDAVAFGSLSRGAPITKTANFTLAATENHIINNKTGSACVVTLPAASGATGREVMITNAQAQAVTSASSNVVPLGGGAAGTAILPALVGAWAKLISDGANWRVTQRGLNPTAVGEALAMAADAAAARLAINFAAGLNAGGSAPLYACRAWVNFNGQGTVAIRAAGNVSSITDNGTGDYTINFTTAMPDENYSIAITVGQGGDDRFTAHINSIASPLTTTSARIAVRNPGNLAAIDPAFVSVAIFR